MQERILRAAINSFLKLGYKQVRMDDLAAEIGISKKTLYNHFGDKYSLFEKAIMLYADESMDELTVLIEARDRDYLERTYRILKIARDKLSRFQLVERHRSRQLRMRDTLLDKIRNRIFSLQEQFIREGQQLGIVREDLPVNTTIYVIASLLESHFHKRQSVLAQGIPDDLPEFIDRVLLEGILTHDAIKRYREIADKEESLV